MRLGITPAGAAGMQRAIAHASSVTPGWPALALDALHKWLRTRSTEFTMEEARFGAVACGLDEPPDWRAWGGVSRTARRLGWIAMTGRTAPAASSHGSQKPTYRSLVSN